MIESRGLPTMSSHTGGSWRNALSSLFDVVGGAFLEGFCLGLQTHQLALKVESDELQDGRDHQARPRDIMPITTPTSSVAPIVPSGFLRAIVSISEANVLTCCEA